MAEKITIYLLRHGRQNSTLCNVNVPLANEGKKQAELAGERLLNCDIDALYSSDLIRAVETAQIIGEKLNIENNIVKGLQEIDFGDMTGLEDKVIKEKFKNFFQERQRFETDLHFPGGENGEQVYTRMKKAMASVITECNQKGYKKIAIVSHGGAIRSFLAGILGMRQCDRFLFAKTMENTAITQIDYDSEIDKYYVERINDYSHIEQFPELMRANFK